MNSSRFGFNSTALIELALQGIRYHVSQGTPWQVLEDENTCTIDLSTSLKLTLTVHVRVMWSKCSSQSQPVSSKTPQLGPAFLVIAGLNLRSLTPKNSIVKFPDDTYLVVPASICRTCAEEKYIENWASSNNLHLNHVKLMHIVFESLRSAVIHLCVDCSSHSQSLENWSTWRNHSIGRKFSLAQHISHFLISCAQPLFAVFLRRYGLQTGAPHAIFRL